eukprot:3986272-Amphidinium_carterae.1
MGSEIDGVVDLVDDNVDLIVEDTLFPTLPPGGWLSSTNGARTPLVSGSVPFVGLIQICLRCRPP